MKITTLMQKQGIGIHKSIQYVGVSNNMPYVTKKPRAIKIDKKSQKSYSELFRADQHMEHEKWRQHSHTRVTNQ